MVNSDRINAKSALVEANNNAARNALLANTGAEAKAMFGKPANDNPEPRKLQNTSSKGNGGSFEVYSLPKKSDSEHITPNKTSLKESGLDNKTSPTPNPVIDPNKKNPNEYANPGDLVRGSFSEIPGLKAANDNQAGNRNSQNGNQQTQIDPRTGRPIVQTGNETLRDTRRLGLRSERVTDQSVNPSLRPDAGAAVSDQLGQYFANQGTVNRNPKPEGQVQYDEYGNEMPNDENEDEQRKRQEYEDAIRLAKIEELENAQQELDEAQANTLAEQWINTLKPTEVTVPIPFLMYVITIAEYIFGIAGMLISLFFTITGFLVVIGTSIGMMLYFWKFVFSTGVFWWSYMYERKNINKAVNQASNRNKLKNLASKNIALMSAQKNVTGNLLMRTLRKSPFYVLGLFPIVDFIVPSNVLLVWASHRAVKKELKKIL